MSEATIHFDVSKIVDTFDSSLIEAREIVTIRCLSAIPFDLEAMLAEIEAEERALGL